MSLCDHSKHYDSFLHKFIMGLENISGNTIRKVMQKPLQHISARHVLHQQIYRAVPKLTRYTPKPFNRQRKIASASHTIDGAIRGAMSMWSQRGLNVVDEFNCDELFIYQIWEYDVVFSHQEIESYAKRHPDMRSLVQIEKELIIKTPELHQDVASVLFVLNLNDERNKGMHGFWDI